MPWLPDYSTCSNTAPIIDSFFVDRTIELIPLLVFSCGLAIFVDFVILARSPKYLGTFKYYIINQTIWAQLFELTIILANPVFLNPFIAGFSGGIFRKVANYGSTMACTTLAFCLFINTFLGVVLTMFNRFILTFHPKLRKYTENKYTLSAIVLLHWTFYIIEYVISSMASTSAQAVRESASKEASGALDSFFTESTFVYAGELDGLTRKVCFYCVFVMIAVLIVLIGSVSWFVYKVIFLIKNDEHLSQASTSLLISSAVQASLCIVFLFLPITCMLISWAYCLDNSANTINALVLMMSIHGTLDMLCTLYFVVPYRNYVVSLFTRKKAHMEVRYITTGNVTRHLGI